MLFRPTADQKLDGIHAMLGSWNAEADRFRQAAIAARKGETPGSMIISAVEEAHDGLMSLLEAIDRAMDALPPGSQDFASLLKAQTIAVSLLESIGSSYDVLDRFVGAPEAAPVHITHDLRIAAE